MLTNLIKHTFAEARHQLVIVRHGESIWNKERKWAGWTDVPLSSAGIQQARECAKIIKKSELTFDEVYTSVLTRSIRTANYILDELNMHYLPVNKQWRLNEKHYGSLQGQKKVEINEKYGSDLVTSWRRSMAVPPPPLDIKDSRHPSNDERYKEISPDLLPGSECLADIIIRLRPLYDAQISQKIKAGKKLLVVAHGSSLRALVYLMDPSKTEEQINNFDIPAAIPIVCNLDQNFKPISYELLGDQTQIQNRIDKMKNQTRKSEID